MTECSTTGGVASPSLAYVSPAESIVEFALKRVRLSHLLHAGQYCRKELFC